MATKRYNQTRKLGARFREDEAKEIEAAAKSARLSLSDWIRARLLPAARRVNNQKK